MEEYRCIKTDRLIKKGDKVRFYHFGWIHGLVVDETPHFNIRTGSGKLDLYNNNLLGNAIIMNDDPTWELGKGIDDKLIHSQHGEK